MERGFSYYELAFCTYHNPNILSDVFGFNGLSIKLGEVRVHVRGSVNIKVRVASISVDSGSE